MGYREEQIEGNYTVQLDSVIDQNNTPVDIGGLQLSGGTEVKKQTTLSLSEDWTVDGTGKIVNKTDPTKVAFDKTATPPINWELLAQAYDYDDVTELQTLKVSVDNPPVTDDFTLQEVLMGTGTATGGASVDLTPYYPNIASFVTDKMTPTGSTLLTYNTTTGAFESIAGAGRDSVTLRMSGVEPAGRYSDIEISFAATTMYNNSGTSTIAAASGDKNKIGCGRKLGEMSGVSIQDDGRIYASYDNGMSKLLGQIAVAEFANASGLAKEGDNLYKATQNSGDFDGIGIEVKSGGGYMTTGVLEMSNVDLSAEFTDMITTQRGFQANSRIITVSDTLLEELVNLKR